MAVECVRRILQVDMPYEEIIGMTPEVILSDASHLYFALMETAKRHPLYSEKEEMDQTGVTLW